MLAAQIEQILLLTGEAQRCVKPRQRVRETRDAGAVEAAGAGGRAHCDSARAIHSPHVEVAVAAASQDTPCLHRLQLPLGGPTQEYANCWAQKIAHIIGGHAVLHREQQRLGKPPA